MRPKIETDRGTGPESRKGHQTRMLINDYDRDTVFSDLSEHHVDYRLIPSLRSEEDIVRFLNNQNQSHRVGLAQG